MKLLKCRCGRTIVLHTGASMTVRCQFCGKRPKRKVKTAK